jgi:hypothetical protein
MAQIWILLQLFRCFKHRGFISYLRFFTAITKLAPPLLLHSCLDYSSSLKVEMIYFSETSGSLQTTKSYNPQECILKKAFVLFTAYRLLHMWESKWRRHWTVLFMKTEQNWASHEVQLQRNKSICCTFWLECVHRVPRTLSRLFNLITIRILIKTFNWL